MSARSFSLSPRRYGNVTVSRSGHHLHVLLHNNLIVDLDVKIGVVKIDHCGYLTPTTASAINNFLGLLGDHRRVCIRSHYDCWDGQRHIVGDYSEMYLRDRKRNTHKRIPGGGISVSFSGRQMVKFIIDQGTHSWSDYWAEQILS